MYAQISTSEISYKKESNLLKQDFCEKKVLP